MEVSRDELAEWLARCKANEPIDPEQDQRYLSLESFDTEQGVVALRGEDNILPMFDCITLRGSSSCQLFSGFNGTGKSTELLRLAGLLRREGYLVLLADAQEYHDLYHPLSIQELLIIVAGAFGEAASALLERDQIREGYWKRFQTFLKTELEIKEADLPALASLKVSVKYGQPFSQHVQKALAGSLRGLRDDAFGFIRQCVAHLQKRHGHSKGVVFLFDSLERLRGSELVFRETMESVIRVLTQYSGYLHLPDCHVIYTVPPYLEMLSQDLANRYDRPLHVLPAVKVLEPGPEIRAFRPGVEALVGLVGKRIPVDRVFGQRLDLLERLIVYSGGHLKTLLTFIGELLIAACRQGLPPTSEQIERLLQAFRERARRAIRPNGLRLLESVRLRGDLDGVRDEDLPLVARYQDTQIVLCYRNGGGWYEVHPLVREHVAKLAAEGIGQ